MPKLTVRRVYGLGLVLFMAAMPLKAAGCGGQTACLTMTKAQLAMSNGVCPTPDLAQQRLNSMGCNPDTIQGPGELEDGFLCCYPIDQPSSNTPCSFGDTAVNSTGDVLPPGDVAVGVGTGCAGGCCNGAGGCSPGDAGEACTTCNDIFMGKAPLVLCGGDTGATFMDLASCACAGPCAMSCASLCSGSSIGSDCRMCLEPPDAGCAVPVSACLQN